MSSFRTIEISDKTYEYGKLRFLTIKTSTLQGRGDICLYVPQTDTKLKDLPIYILLHGVYGSSWAWALKGGAAQSAEEMMLNNQIKPAIIAMPSDGLWGDGSAYFAHHQKDFEQWIVSDVPNAIIENIPEASPKSQLCIGGLSMGGYGALILGAKHPTKFKAISGHSSITRLEQMSQFVEEPIQEYENECEIPNVIDAIALNQHVLPSLRFDCGTNDSLIEENRMLHEQMEALKIEHTYQEFEGGHEWPYWQKHVKKTFLFFDKNI